jgi:hypothetical protein
MDVRSVLEKEKMDLTLRFEAQINERDLKIKSKIFCILVSINHINQNII